MTMLSTQRITPEELLEMPDSGSLELVDGELVEKNMSRLSSQTEGTFLKAFADHLELHPVGEVYPQSLGYRCFPDDPGKVRKPDVTVVRVERLAELGNEDPGFMPIVPDLAVEVISPNDLAYDLTEKVREYHAAGFPLVWLADPESRMVTVHPRGGRPTIYTQEDEITAEGAMPGFRCRVGDLFPAPLDTTKRAGAFQTEAEAG